MQLGFANLDLNCYKGMACIRKINQVTLVVFLFQ